MIIDTDKIDKTRIAIVVLKRGGLDWIDQDPDQLWADVAPEDRARRILWRNAIVDEKVRELETLFAAMESVSAD